MLVTPTGAELKTGQDPKVLVGVTDGALTSHLNIKGVVAWSLTDNVSFAHRE